MLLPRLERRRSVQKNRIIHLIDSDQIDLNGSNLASTTPFVVEKEGRRYLFTRDENDDEIANYEYVLLCSRKPQRRDFVSDSLRIEKWLKHPQLESLTPSQVVSSWEGHFRIIKENENRGIKGLRPPQVSALYSILAHIENADDIAIVVMPTGTGKTETMLSTLVAASCQKILVAVPSDSLRTQISDKFVTLGLLKKLGLADENCSYPIVGILNSMPTTAEELSSIAENSNVVVSTMKILSDLPDDYKRVLKDSFSHLFVDEAHHSQAKTWKNLIDNFPKNKVFLFTATPYRNDGKKLDGKFISVFSLKKAQEQKYYKKINNLPIREYDKRKADKAIADQAVEQLRQDIEAGYNHILLARCASRNRAIEVFECYEPHADLNPVLVYTGVQGLSKRIEAIREKKHSIIVCVDMLGEGFDLPELKIAAVHDERQSIPITLQFIGRFTRTSYDNLGNASFITNLAYPPLKQELDQLYNRDNDWNAILPSLSESATQKELDFNEFLEGFQNLHESEIPFQSINPALSAVCFKFNGDTWRPNEWREGIGDIDTYEHQYSDYNPAKNTLVIILGKVVNVDWGTFDVVQNIEWNIIVVFWDRRPNCNRIFVNTSFKSLSYSRLLSSIFDGDFQIVDGMDVFKIFHDVKRLTLFNVGAKKVTGKDISFQSFFGRDVQDGINLIEQGKLIKNNIFGVGYKLGEKISLGCSVKGKVWSYLRGNLDELTKWCSEIGDILENQNIDSNIVLTNTLVPQTISTKPQIAPIAVDWNSTLYEHSEGWLSIQVGNETYDLANSELDLSETESDQLRFELVCEEERIEFEYTLGERVVDAVTISFFEIRQVNEGIMVQMNFGSRSMTATEFFNENSPNFWFADGSQLFENRLVTPRDTPDNLPMENVIPLDWTGVSLNKESQGISPYVQDSIQYNFIDKIMNDYQIIYDDDGSGEIADVVGINDSDDEIDIHLFHLKFAKGGNVSNNIDNFYQVCGQAQKSINWKYRNGRDFFDHLLRRITKTKNNETCSRLVKGTEEQLEVLLNAAKWIKKMKFHIYIVQPGVSKNNISQDILTLLSNTYHYLGTVGNAELKVYTS